MFSRRGTKWGPTRLALHTCHGRVLLVEKQTTPWPLSSSDRWPRFRVLGQKRNVRIAHLIPYHAAFRNSITIDRAFTW